MRIKLKEGKQKELILKAKGNSTWEKLANKLGINEKYLYYELKNEMRLLDGELYKKLCLFANENFDKFISERLDNNWGRSKGGLNSEGSTKRLPKIEFDERLAEFIGAVLGDGHVCSYKRGKKVGVYCIKIAGDLEKDKDYHINYLKKLVEEVFNLKPVEQKRPKYNERFLDIYSKEIINLFISMGIKPGNKIKNQSTIPRWIFEDKQFLRVCLRGLIDTDGSIFRMSKRDYRLIRINFTNHNITLLNDVRKAFLDLGYHPSKLINNRQFYISRQEEIKKYLKEIGFSNNKHKERLKSLVV